MFRIKVVKTFLRAAVRLSKLEVFRELLEESAYSLTDRRHMSDMVPFVHSQEIATIKQELSGSPLSVVFDGTTRLGEALAIVIRFVNDDLYIRQRLVRLQLLSKSMSREEIARELIDTLSVQYSVSSGMLLAAMHDRASVNNVAMRTLSIVLPSAIDVGCFSHMLDLVGEKFDVPHLAEFSTWWISLFSHSPKARLLWTEQSGRPMPGYSLTRWWLRWEVIKNIMELFPDVEIFLRGNEDHAPATRTHLLAY